MTTNADDYISGDMSQQYWRYTVAPAGKKVQLLTIGNVCVLGQWYGALGQYFNAWSPLLKDVKTNSVQATRVFPPVHIKLEEKDQNVCDYCPLTATGFITKFGEPFAKSCEGCASKLIYDFVRNDKNDTTRLS